MNFVCLYGERLTSRKWSHDIDMAMNLEDAELYSAQTAKKERDPGGQKSSWIAYNHHCCVTQSTLYKNAP